MNRVLGRAGQSRAGQRQRDGSMSRVLGRTEGGDGSMDKVLGMTRAGQDRGTKWVNGHGFGTWPGHKREVRAGRADKALLT